jgi:hypothetical protein
VVVEEVLKHAKEFAHISPKLVKDTSSLPETAAPPSTGLDPKEQENRHALAIFLLDGYLNGDDAVNENEVRPLLSYLVGLDRNERSFSLESEPRAGALASLRINRAQYRRLQDLDDPAQLKRNFDPLLSDEELAALSKRIHLVISGHALDDFGHAASENPH